MAGAPAFIAISITALAAGGPELLAALVIVSSLVTFIVSARLSLLRQVLTPTISGTVTMLIPVTVMPYVIEMLDDVPQGSSVLPGSVSFFVTVCVIAMILLTASGRVRTWAPIIGIVIGSVVAAMFGIYDYERVAQGKQVSEESIEQEVSIRMLKHIASSVRHQQFHNTDVITIRVEAIKSAVSGNLI